MITAFAVAAVGLGWVRLANLIGQVLAEFLVIACVAAVAAYRYRSPR
jgi:hypothetical protein